MHCSNTLCVSQYTSLKQFSFLVLSLIWNQNRQSSLYSMKYCKIPQTWEAWHSLVSLSTSVYSCTTQFYYCRWLQITFLWTSQRQHSLSEYYSHWSYQGIGLYLKILLNWLGILYPTMEECWATWIKKAIGWY